MAVSECHDAVMEEDAVLYCTVLYCTVLAVSECHDAVMEEDWTRKNLNIMQELTVLSLYII